MQTVEVNKQELEDVKASIYHLPEKYAHCFNGIMIDDFKEITYTMGLLKDSEGNYIATKLKI